MCWEIFCCCCNPKDEGTAAQKLPPPQPLGPLPGSATNGVSSDSAQTPPSAPLGPRASSETNGASKPPGANPEEPPIAAPAAAAAAGGDSSSQESGKVDPAIKEGNKKSEDGKKRLKPSTNNTVADNPTKEKEQVKDASSEKRGHDKSADRKSLQEGKPTYEHAHEAAAAASSKPSSVQKNETVGWQANPRRTNQEERRVSTAEPTREAAVEHSQFSSVDGIGSQANPGRINQDQGRRVSTKGPGESMSYL